MQQGIIYDQTQFNCLPGEVWLPITGFLVPNVNPYYYISNRGRVWSTFINNVMKTHMTEKGYAMITLSKTDGTSIHLLLHRLVMLAFNWIPGCEKLDVNHCDGDKSHNELSNLEWSTHSDNLIHAYKIGLKGKGEAHCNSTHTEEQIHKICQGLEQRLSLLDCAEMAGMERSDTSKKYVSDIKRGITWTDISSQYNIPSGDYRQLFTDEQVHHICRLLEQGLTNEEIINVVSPGMPKSAYENVMRSIRNRTRLKRISNNYNF